MDKRTRKSRFSGKEISELLQQVSENAATINSKMSNPLIHQRKKDVWTFIQSAVNSVESSGPERTVDEVKKKWNDLKGAVIRYKSDVSGAGGERPLNVPPFYDVIMDILADKKVSLNGRTHNDLVPSPADGWDEVEMKTIQIAASACPNSSVQGTVNVISIDPFSSSSSMKRSPTPTSTVISEEATQEHTLSHHSFPASSPSNTEAMAANNVRINKIAKNKKRRKLRHPREDELWKEYLTEEIKVKKLQQSKLEEEIKTQRVMREYYKTKLEKLS